MLNYLQLLGTKTKWVKKNKSQVGGLSQLKLKITVLYGNRDVEIHMTQPDEFVTAESVSVG